MAIQTQSVLQMKVLNIPSSQLDVNFGIYPRNNDISAQVEDLQIGTIRCSTDLATVDYNLKNLFEVFNLLVEIQQLQ